MARDFNGTTDRIDWASVANQTGHAQTISMWAYADTYVANGYLLCIHDSGDASFGIIINTSSADPSFGYVSFLVNGTTDLQRASVTGTLETGAWINIIVTWTGAINSFAGVHIYKNGTEVSYSTETTGATETTHTGSWSLGGRIYDNARMFDGKIAFVGVWNAVVDAATITGLAAKNSPDFYPTNLLFYAINGADYTNHVTGANGTLDGTIVYADPPQNWPWNKKTTRVGNESINRSTIW